MNPTTEPLKLSLGLCLGDTPSFDPPFQKSSEIADFVGKIRSKCGTNKGVSKEGVSPKHRRLISSSNYV